LLYVASCAPGALWQDSGMVQYRVWHNDIEGGLGLALSHPLFYILAIGAKFVPVGEFGFRVNVVSGIAAAFAIANLFLFVRLLVGKNFAAVVAAVTFAVSHTFWRHACIAETYTLYTALFTGELVMLAQYVKWGKVKYLYWLGLLNGLAISVHMLGAIPLSCYSVLFIVLLVRKNIRVRDLAVVVLLWIVGALPYEYLIVKNLIVTGDFWGTLSSVAFGKSWCGDVLNTSLSGKIIKEDILFCGLNFPTPNFVLFFVGVFGLFRTHVNKALRNMLPAVLIVFFLFAFRYTIQDRYAFFIPFYCVASIFMGLGVSFLREKMHGKLFAYLVVFFAFVPVGVYAVVPKLAERMQVNLDIKRQIPYRNDYTHFLRPWQGHNYGPELFARKALTGVEDDAVIIADGTTVYPLWYYQQVKGKRRNVRVVSRHSSYESPIEYPTEETIGQLMSERAVYVVSPVAGYCPAYLLAGYDFIQEGVLYHVVERQ